MAAVSEDATADLNRRIAELERQLESALVERDAAIDRQTASALISFRLQNEVRAAVERQKASAEILRAIANTHGDAEHALQRIAETTQHFFNAAGVTIRIAEGDEWMQTVRVGASAQLTGSQPAAQFATRGANLPATVYQENRQIHIPDLDNVDPSMADWPATAARAAGIRTICGTPLRHGGKAIGALLVYRDRFAAFTDDELALQQTFADQAVIAIENARLFNETQEALERQTATSDILRVISQSPTDVRPVFHAILQTVVRLLHCDRAFIHRCAGNSYFAVATATPDGSLAELGYSVAIDPNANFPSRAIIGKTTLYYPDWSLIELPENERGIRERFGINCALYLPLLRDEECIGLLTLVSTQPGRFGDDEIALAESFRDQALIAVENTRLFNETQAALERQTATADILKVIASSPSDVQPVFEAIVASGNRLIGGYSTAVFRFIDGVQYLKAFTPTTPEADDVLKSTFPMPLANLPQAQIGKLLNGETDQIPDTEIGEEFQIRIARARGFRSIMFTPLMHQGTAIGIISVTRRETGRFADHHVQLLRTFADQAVIAIENTRLFNETQEALERQTATSDILKVIASSPSDVQPVFEAIAQSSKHLIGGFSTAVFRLIDGIVHLASYTSVSPEADALLKASFPRPIGELYFFDLAKDGEVVEQVDIDANPDARLRDLARARGFRSALLAPLMSKETSIGLIVVTRKEPGRFAKHHIQLLQTFADQAVIAIENARLFNETQEALERQTATSDILKVIASSPSDVQPVFEAIAERSNQLVNGLSTAVLSLVDDALHLVAYTQVSPDADAALRAFYPQPLSTFAWGEAVRRGEIVRIPDSEDEAATRAGVREVARARGWRSALLVPLLRDRRLIGMISATRRESGPFADHHVQLLQTFADQAVIAIENARLFNETQEALERQTATADILKVIASSPSDVQPVFDAIATSANRLLGGFSSTVFRFIDGVAHLKAFTPTTPEADQVLTSSFPRPIADVAPFQMTGAGEVVQIPDTEAPTYELKDVARARGYRSMLFAPLMNKGTSIGFIAVTRVQPGDFVDHHVQLLKTFADQAVIAIENTRLFNEVQERTRDLEEALRYQTGSANILNVIASSPTDVGPVLDAIVESACELCEAFDALVRLRNGDYLDYSAHHGPIPAAETSVPIRRNWPAGLAVIEQKPVHVHDILDSEGDAFPEVQDLGRRHGYRTVLTVPLLRENDSIGAIVLRRAEVKPFSQKQIALLQTFADQAVIAIENARLFNEVQERTRDLSESLQQQTATADVLKVISRSAFDLDAVLYTLIESAVTLSGAECGTIFQRRDELYHLTAQYGYAPEMLEYGRANPLAPSINSNVGRTALTGAVVQMPDVLTDPDFTSHGYQRLGNFRAMLGIPLKRGGKVEGVFSLAKRDPGLFEPRHIELVQTFADQAVIAIENARLFNEVQERTVELTEALEQQTATAEVLRVISSSGGDLAPVFDAMLGKAMELCSANFGVLNTYDGELFHTAATYGLPPAYDQYRRSQPQKYGPGTSFALLLQGEPVVEIADLPESEAYRQGEPNRRALVDIGGARCLLAVPLLKDERVVGNVMIFRQENKRFSEKQITLLKQFAAQAVIAIENTRLLRELRERTEDLSESLQQQTATSEVLQMISSSPGDLAPVFDKMLESATRVCGAEFGSMILVEDGSYQQAALYNAPAEFAAARTRKVLEFHPRSAPATALRSRQVVQVEDLRNEPSYLERSPAAVDLAELGGARTIVVVPMVRDDQPIGVMTVYRQEVRPFGDKQIELLSNFARQAVIAIENARLLRELRQRTDDLTEALTYQTGSSNILKVIASSPTDVKPVLQAIVESACELCEAADAVVVLKDDGGLVFAAHHGPIPLILEKRAISRGFAAGRAVVDRVSVHIHDVLSDEGDEFPEARELSAVQGIRSVLSVPLMRDEESIGAILLRRTEVHPFNDKQIELLKSFADQAVIAISNVRLFEQVQERTRELSRSLEDLRTAQGRLIQTEKLASLGQLTAGIAHEIKNPLNFVNNFSALSVELTDELNDVLKQAELAERIRKEVDELTGMLKDNLFKVVQHGKRADSIVKNMLLHSREGSGEHRPTDVNALVDESLNLAYHGARAEKPQFNVTLNRDFDPQAGTVEVFPQEITRVLLNLISNGFYAVTKRKNESGGPGFDPVVSATTRNLGDSVEIRIRDNGTGIPPEVKEKMFNPFFTTKPAGEGTGLGLSMSHDIIVKQHGGTIDVETEPGAFTEFRLVLPRTSQSGKGAGH